MLQLDPNRDPDAANEQQIRADRLSASVETILEILYASKDYVPQ